MFWLRSLHHGLLVGYQSYELVRAGTFFKLFTPVGLNRVGRLDGLFALETLGKLAE